MKNENAEVVSAVDLCKKTFAACKTMQDGVAEAVQSCSVSTVQFMGKMKGLSSSMSTMEQIVSMSSTTSRQAAEISCADFIAEAKEVRCKV